jgi:hypothetical protein
LDRLQRSDLLTLEAYAAQRAQFRARVLAHKRARTLALGAHATLLFEDRLTVHYQVQEMLRIERVFEPQGIQDELDAYNALIPDGGNLKATLLLEFPDERERREALAQLGGIEHRVRAEVDGFAPVAAIADEDLERTESGKTSAVHFLRFEFPAPLRQALRDGAGLAFAIDDPRLPARSDVTGATRAALLADFG